MKKQVSFASWFRFESFFEWRRIVGGEEAADRLRYKYHAKIDEIDSINNNNNINDSTTMFQDCVKYLEYGQEQVRTVVSPTKSCAKTNPNNNNNNNNNKKKNVLLIISISIRNDGRLWPRSD